MDTTTTEETFRFDDGELVFTESYITLKGSFLNESGKRKYFSTQMEGGRGFYLFLREFVASANRMANATPPVVAEDQPE